MKNSIIGFWVLVCLVCGQGCEYEPVGTNPQNVSKPSPPSNAKLEVGTLNNGDTLLARFYNVKLKLNALTSGYDIVDIYYTVNGSGAIDVGYAGTNNYLSIPLSQLNIGLNTVVLKMVLDSESKSIANLLGLENFVYTKQFYILRLPSEKSTFAVSSKIENGLLKIEWDKYAYADFSYYWLNMGGAAINNPNQNYVFKPYFVETNPSSVVEQIEVFENTKKVSVASASIAVNYPVPPLTVDNRGGELHFSWPKTKFFNAPVKYVLRNYYNGGMEPVWFQSTNPNDTSFVMTNLPFGADFNVELVFLTKYQENTTLKSGSVLNNFSCGDPIPESVQYSDLVDLASGDLIGVANYTLYKYNEAQNAIVKQQPLGFEADMRYYSSANRGYIIGYDSYSMAVINPASLAVKYYSPDDVYKIKQNMGLDPASYVIQYALIDDLGRIYICLADYSYAKPIKLIRYDPSSKTYAFINVDSPDSLWDWYSLSAMSAYGNYAFFGGDLFHIVGITATKLGDFNGGYFTPNSPAIICRTAYQLFPFNTATNELSYEPLCSFNEFSTISPNRNYAVIRPAPGYLNYNLVSLKTGDIVRSNLASGCFVLSGSYIYGPNHKRIKLD